MTLRELLEKQIEEFLDSSDGMLPEKKKEKLFEIFDKFLYISTLDIKFELDDFKKIKEHAVRKYIDNAWPKYFSGGRATTPQESANLCLVEAVIDYLKAKDCLKKTPYFNYQRNK